MSNEQKKSNINRIGTELTDGAGTNEFSSNQPLTQENTGWDSSRYNQWPAGPFSDIGFGHHNEDSNVAHDLQPEHEEEEYTVRTSWGSGTKDLPNISNEGPRDPDGKEPSVGIGSDSKAIYPGIEENRRNNESQTDWDIAGAGLVGTHDLGDDVEDVEDNVDDDIDDDGEINFNDDDGEELMDDELDNEYDDELGNTPRKEY